MAAEAMETEKVRCTRTWRTWTSSRLPQLQYNRAGRSTLLPGLHPGIASKIQCCLLQQASKPRIASHFVNTRIDSQVTDHDGLLDLGPLERAQCLVAITQCEVYQGDVVGWHITSFREFR